MQRLIRHLISWKANHESIYKAQALHICIGREHNAVMPTPENASTLYLICSCIQYSTSYIDSESPE
jgi:hypothetical protein